MVLSKMKSMLFIGIIAISSSYSVQAHPSVVQQYKEQLQAQDRALLRDFLDSFGISEHEWIEFKKTCENAYDASESKLKKAALQSSNQTVSPRIKELFLQVLKQATLTRSISVIRAHNSNFDVDTFRSLMLVNENNFERIHPQDDQAIAKIWHEVMHLYHDDSFMDFCLRDLKSKVMSDSTYFNWFGLTWFGAFIAKCRKNFNQDAWEITYKKWKLFREKRADILSGLISPAMAQAWVSMLKNYLITSCDCGSDHPSGSERLAYMTELRDKMVSGA